MVRLPRARLAAACASIALLAVTLLAWPHPDQVRIVARSAAAPIVLPAPPVDTAAIAAAVVPSTTSTTLARRSSVAPAPHAVRPTTASHPSALAAGPHPCGGDLPPCWVMMRESRGDPTAWNPNGCYLKPDKDHPVARRGCAGKWQMDWNAWPPGFDGYDRADHAPEALQDARAREMWAGGRGCAHWAAC